MALYDKINQTSLRLLKHEGRGLYVSYGRRPSDSGDPGIPASNEERNQNAIVEALDKRRRDVIRVFKATTTRNPLHLPRQLFLNVQDKSPGVIPNRLAVVSAAKETALTQVSNLAQTAINGTGVNLPKGGKGTVINPGYDTPFVTRPGSQFITNDTLAANLLGRRKDKNPSLFRGVLRPNESRDIPENVEPYSDRALGSNGRVDSSNFNTPKKPKGVQLEERLGYKVKINPSNSNDPTSRDYINSLEVTTEFLQEYEDKQIIPFRISVYDPNRPEQSDLLFFRAYLESMSDSYSGDWNATKYFGRAENLYNYNGFDRDFNFGFKIAASSQEDLLPLYRKLNRLVGTTAPSYSTDQQFMRGVFCTLTIGTYLTSLPGFFTNIDLSWSTEYPWEIGIDENGLRNLAVPLVPHILDVSLRYKPVHNFNPAYAALSNDVERAYLAF